MENQLAKTNQEVVFNFFDPQQFETMQRICKMFANSDLVPEIYKTNLALKDGAPINPENKAIANCMVAIEMSQRIGASPLMIMQNMDIIYGRPSWRSKFLVATVNTCGRFNPIQYKIANLGKLGKISYTAYEKKWIDGKDGKKGYYKNEAKQEIFDGTNIDNLECVAYTTAKGSDAILESSPASVMLAIQEGWYTKSGSKWPTMTRQMLMYRAASFWTSTYAPELSMGMKTTEEIEDIIDVDYEDMTAKTVEKEIKDNANKGETIGFEEKKPEDEKKTLTPNPEKLMAEPKESKDKNLTKLKELGYTEEDIKAMSPADEMRIIMGNVKKESKPGF